MNRSRLDHDPTPFSSNETNPLNSSNLNCAYINHQHPLLQLPTNQRPPNDSIQIPGPGSDGGSSYSSIKGDFAGAVFKYISDMLMEEDLGTKTCMLQDSLALQAAEKSFYDCLGPAHNSSPSLNIDSSSISSSSSSSTAAANMVDSFFIFNQVQYGQPSTQISFSSPPENTLLRREQHGKTQNLWQFKGVTEEVSKYLPREDAADSEKIWRFNLSNARGRKIHLRDDGDYVEERRSNKLCAPSLAESQLSDLFDEVLLCKHGNDESKHCSINDQAQKRASVKMHGRTTQPNKQDGSEEEDLLVDLWTLLTQCAQAVSCHDKTMANELLKQIRQHSSPFGDALQRMAHYFANALEARLAGIRTPAHTLAVYSKTSAADIIKAYKVHISVCPFRAITNAYTNRKIAKLAEKAARIHIIDFGILYGFQWPCFLQRISGRPGGPPKIRITGIDFPQPGFRPAERVEETGRRLKVYCERFNIPFEYKTIAGRWESIRLEDLKMDKEELTIVTCLYRLKNLPDDTMVLNSSRDAVLRLIKRINPRLFVHGVVNGSFNASFFTTRFREALYYYSTMFDIYETNLPREDEERLVFERETLGREAMNVIACEGSERVERPETYKQWQARNLRIGFRQLPLDQEILEEVRTSVRAKYHEDYVIHEDGKWMLQGWKGRIVQALSCWKPVKDWD